MNKDKITKTNFQMYMEVKDHYKKHIDIEKGILAEREINLINTVFQLDIRTLTGLQNLRDFICAITSKSPSPVEWDMMSAITHVIDGWKIKLGGSV